MSQSLFGDRSSSWGVDIVIPCVAKDRSTIGLVIKSLRQFLRHPIGQIFLVCPRDAGLESIVGSGIVIVDEREFMGFGPDALEYFPQGLDRRGWLFQQLIKLQADQLGTQPYLLIMDADTVMVRPQSFERQGRILVQYADAGHEPYRANLQTLTPQWSLSERPFVCHHFFLEKADLAALRRIVAGGQNSWIERITSTLDATEISGFSEYELMGNYYVNERPDAIELDYFFNRGITEAAFFTAWKRPLFRWYHRTVSMHHYPTT